MEEVKRIAIQESGMKYAKRTDSNIFSEGSDYVRQMADIHSKAGGSLIRRKNEKINLQQECRKTGMLFSSTAAFVGLTAR